MYSSRVAFKYLDDSEYQVYIVLLLSSEHNQQRKLIYLRYLPLFLPGEIGINNSESKEHKFETLEPQLSVPTSAHSNVIDDVTCRHHWSHSHNCSWMMYYWSALELNHIIRIVTKPG
jgi:hypothetical protein